MTDAGTCGAVLSVDLDAIVANWRLLRDRAPGAACGAVVKADAYGLGAERVAPALAAAGCEAFFVATLDEGIALRRYLPRSSIHVLNGLAAGSEAVHAEYDLSPVLGSLGEIDAWRKFVEIGGPSIAVAIHVDTGMSRLGLPANELAVVAADPGRLAGIDPQILISHLVSAEEPENPINPAQREAFLAARSIFPAATASLANSSGVFLGPDYHFDLVRPGAALYGLAPQIGVANPMAQVIRLQGRILQVREIDSPQTVGYGATHRAAGRERIATVGVGYADGYPRTLSNVASGFVGDIRVPLVGRVSMDLITFDVSAAPESLTRPGDAIDLIGPNHGVDDLAAEAGTIGYEILTNLGRRYHRADVGGDAA